MYKINFYQTLLSRIEVPDPSESEYETDTDEEEEEEAEEIMRPIFIPKAKRETIKEQELKMEEMKLRDEKKLIQDEDRKRQVRYKIYTSHCFFSISLLCLRIFFLFFFKILFCFMLVYSLYRTIRHCIDCIVLYCII